jgi:hypothetical protein
MEECVLLWPSGPGSMTNDRRRLIFTNGMNASKMLRILVGTPSDIHKPVYFDGDYNTHIFGIHVISTDACKSRSNPDAFRISERYLLLNTSVAMEEIKDLIDSWAIHNSAERSKIISSLGEEYCCLIHIPRTLKTFKLSF